MNKLNSLLHSSVEISMTSDVEVGSFLSGGTDSSLITAIMQSVSDKKIQTFSVAVNDKKYNENNIQEQFLIILKPITMKLKLVKKILLTRQKLYLIFMKSLLEIVLKFQLH